MTRQKKRVENHFYNQSTKQLPIEWKLTQSAKLDSSSRPDDVVVAVNDRKLVVVVADSRSSHFQSIEQL